MAADVFRTIEGLHLGKHFPDDAILSTIWYKPKAGDVFLVGYPKSGSTWTHRIIYNILMNAEDPKDPLDYFIRLPCLAMQGADAARYAPHPSAFKTHLPFHKNPYSPEAKYIYIARNPYDTCVSFYYHTKHMPAYKFGSGTFDEFFELFLQGRVDYGDYFEHVTSWYKHRNEPNVLFLTYEEMKKDTRGHVHKIAAFLGHEKKKQLEENHELVERVLENTNLVNMKKALNYSMRRNSLLERLVLTNVRPELQKGLQTLIDFIKVPMSGDFVRKGEIGDWRNHFSPEQIRRMKEKIDTAKGGSDLMTLWKDFDLP